MLEVEQLLDYMQPCIQFQVNDIEFYRDEILLFSRNWVKK